MRVEVDDPHSGGTGYDVGSLVGKLTDALRPILNANQEAIFNRLTGLDASINALSQELASFKHEAAQANEVNRATAQFLTERLDRLDKTIGVQTDSGNTPSLADRLDLHEQLLERLNHSQAPGEFSTFASLEKNT
jgi:regulator of replication initiation timing